MIGSTELILIVVVALLVFGGKKIPELMRGLGRGVRSFKEGMHEVTEEINGSNEKKCDPTREDEPKAE